MRLSARGAFDGKCVMTLRPKLSRGLLDGRIFVRAAAIVLALAAWCAVRNASPALADPVAPAWRVIVLKGAAVPQLLGSPESHLEALALRGGHLAPIPFQVDEVLPDGRYALTDGPEPLSDDSPGILDRDDEIAMMLSDMGDRASPPPVELPASALEIEAEDTATHTPRYAYLAAAPSPYLNPISYVSYDPAHSSVEGVRYRMVFRGDFPVGLALRDGRGKFSPSLIEGTQVQVAARVLKLFKLRLNASGVANGVMAWHGGPVRLIRRVSHSVRLLFGIESPRVFSDEIFYRDYAEDSFAAWVPWVPRLFFDDVQVRTWLDFVGLEDFMLGWRTTKWHPLAPESKRAALALELRDDEPEVSWLALRGGGGIVMQTFMPSPDFATLRRRLYYCDGAADEDKSRQAGSSSAGDGLQIGYLITGWENLAAGPHRVDSILMVLPDGAEPQAVASELAAAPAVKVRPARP
jgi:hypothetical protein